MNATKDDQLLLAKQRLMCALGDNQNVYLSNMKQWFRQKWSKEEFDRESRKLLDIEHIHLHNHFFLALLNKIQPLKMSTNGTTGTLNHSRPHSTFVLENPSGTLNITQTSRIVVTNGINGSPSKRRKRSSRPTTERVSFDVADFYEYMPQEVPEIVRTPGANSPPPLISPQRFSAQELFLPDASLVMGRLLVGAWESGLVSADENVSEMIVLAVQNLLKNIITTILLKRKHCRSTAGGTFIYDVGIDLTDPSLRTSAHHQQVGDAPVEIDRTITSMSVIRPDKRDDALFVSRCEDLDPRPKSRINVLDLYKAMADRQVIPSHSVYANNLERIGQKLH